MSVKQHFPNYQKKNLFNIFEISGLWSLVFGLQSFVSGLWSLVFAFHRLSLVFGFGFGLESFVFGLGLWSFFGLSSLGFHFGGLLS